MFEVIVLFLALSLLFYCLFAGADFGAGILEGFSSRTFREKGQKLTYEAIGPVWEANHIWLILVVVILFMGFPKVYTTISVALHIPISAMLIGIVLRGCFFTFRHYDPIKGRSQGYYTGIFVFSSIATSLFLGIIAGAITLGRINPEATDFARGFIDPWFNLFSFAVGIFACCIFTFLAAVYLIGEAKEEEIRRIFLDQAIKSNIVTVIAGGFVFIAAQMDGLDLIELLWSHPLSAACLVLATLSLPVLWFALVKRRVILPRLLAGFQVTMILVAWLWMQYPSVINLSNGEDLTLHNTRAPEATLQMLGWALIIGSMLILPALFYLLKSFKWKQEQMH
jgi:cytochrome bd ubiquinol oxidase subunit II